MSKSIADIEEITRIDNLKHQISQEIKEAENRGSIHITIGMTNYKGNYNLLRSDISKVKADFSNAHYLDDWQITINQFNEVDIIKIVSPLKSASSLFRNHVVPVAAWGIGSTATTYPNVNIKLPASISNLKYKNEDEIISFFKESVLPELKKTKYISFVDIPIEKILELLDLDKDIFNPTYVKHVLNNEIFEKPPLILYGLKSDVVGRLYDIIRITADKNLSDNVKGDTVRYFGFVDLKLDGIIMDNIDKIGNELGWIDPEDPDFLKTVKTQYKLSWAPQMIEYYKIARADLLTVYEPLN